jgi:hypothetical protein
VATQPAAARSGGAFAAVEAPAVTESDDDKARLTVNEAKTKLKNVRKNLDFFAYAFRPSRKDHWCLGASLSKKV